MTANDITQLIATLVGLGAQFGPALVKDVSNLIHGNPKTPGETDEAYVARIGAQIDQNTQRVVDQDKDIQQG